jgi:hypothetical protein
MKSFKIFINEIFTKKYRWFWLTDSPNSWESYAYFFSEDEKLYCVGLNKLFIDDPNSKHKLQKLISGIEIGFIVFPDYKAHSSLYNIDPYDKINIEKYIESGSGTDKKLDVNTKNVPAIFATIIDIIKAYNDRFDPKAIVFYAKNDEQNRVSLYTRIVKRLSSELNLKMFINKINDTTQFTLIK